MKIIKLLKCMFYIKLPKSQGINQRFKKTVPKPIIIIIIRIVQLDSNIELYIYKSTEMQFNNKPWQITWIYIVK